jgi:hypothetical protein
MTPFTKITAKNIQVLQGLSDYKHAWRVLSGIRDSCGVNVLLLCHLAQYWSVDEKSIIAQLSPQK